MLGAMAWRGVTLGTWEVEYRPLGWIRLTDSHGGPSVYLEFEHSGPTGQERFDLKTVVMRTGAAEPLSGRAWRRVPFSDLERRLQEEPIRDVLTARPSGVTPPSLDSLDTFFETTAEMAAPAHRMPTKTVVASAQDEGTPTQAPVIQAPQGRITDDFLKDIADAYRWSVGMEESPAPAIAKQADVPVRTVHRWIYEARKRGILPPARTGRAG